MVLSFGSALSWYAAQLMPDVWTLILILTLSAVAIDQHLSRAWSILYAVILMFALLTHLSHVPLFGLMLLSIGVLGWMWKVPTFSLTRWK